MQLYPAALHMGLFPIKPNGGLKRFQNHWKTLPSLKLTVRILKIDGWKTIPLPFGGLVLFSGASM